MTDALRREVADYGIDVVLIEPGGLDTGIWDGLPRRRERSPNRTAYDRSLQCCERQDRSRAAPGKRRRSSARP
ncbi:MAG: hypothetical protein M3P37_00100 [Actinomycetota bacterium]|nr:hypothetical protein [Actinomycetota bacterium]